MIFLAATIAISTRHLTAVMYNFVAHSETQVRIAALKYFPLVHRDSTTWFKGKLHSCHQNGLKRTLLSGLKKKVTSVWKKTVLSWKRHFYQKNYRYSDWCYKIISKKTLLSENKLKYKIVFSIITLWFKTHVKRCGLCLTLRQIRSNKSKSIHLPKYLHVYYAGKNRKD